MSGVVISMHCNGYPGSDSPKGGRQKGSVWKMRKRERQGRLTPRSSVHSLKIRMTSHPCNKYEAFLFSKC